MVCQLDFDLLPWWCAPVHERLRWNKNMELQKYVERTCWMWQLCYKAFHRLVSTCADEGWRGTLVIPVSWRTDILWTGNHIQLLTNQQPVHRQETVSSLPAGNFAPSVLLYTLSSWCMVANGLFSSHTVSHFSGFWIAPDKILLNIFWIGFRQYKQCTTFCVCSRR